MSDIAKLNGTIEELSKSIYDFKKKHTEDYAKDKAVTESAINKMTEEVTKLMQEKQDLEARIKFMEAQNKEIERKNENGMTAEQKEIHKLFPKFLRGAGISQDFKAFLTANMEQKDLSSDSNPDGGYTIMPEYLGIMEKRIFETSPIRSVATVASTSNESIIITADNDELTAGWVGERESRDKTETPELDEIQIHAQELYAKPIATQRILEDAGFDVEQWLMRKIADKFSRMENDAFVNGNGAKRPRGFLTYPDWTTAGVYQTKAIEQIASGNASELTADGLIDLQNSLIEDYQMGAVFGMTRSTFGAVMKLKTDDGEYLFNRMLDKETGTPFNLLGKPVYFFNDMPEVDSGNLAVVYGNFAQTYMIVDRKGIDMLRDPYSNKPNVEFYTKKRVGGDVCNFESLKIQRISAS